MAHADSVRRNIHSWCRPHHDRLKLNTDVDINLVDNIIGLGWVLRDDEGRFLAAKSVLFTGFF